jgi:hypothetical protein
VPKDPREPRWPGPSSQTAIIGQNGSGKTVAALWHFSRSNFTEQPWIVFDYKGEEEIGSIEKAEYIGIGELPKRPGIYIVQPTGQDDENVDLWFDAIRERERIGIYVDEGYMVPNQPPRYNGLRNLLVQGRSKHIPRLLLSQRPSMVSRFVFSEANFHQVYFLADKRDHQIVSGFIPNYDGRSDLPDFHSRYYDVGKRRLTILQPVPKAEVSLQVIEDRLKTRRKFL